MILLILTKNIYISLLCKVYAVIQLLSCFWLFETPWTAACQASPCFTIFQSLLKRMSVMSSNHLILCCLLLLLPSIFSISGSFPVSQLLAIRWPNIGASASASILPMNIQGWFPLRLTSLTSLLCKELSRVLSSTTIWKHQFFSTQTSLWSSLSQDYWENHNFDYRDLCQQWCLCFLICCLGLS